MVPHAIALNRVVWNAVSLASAQKNGRESRGRVQFDTNTRYLNFDSGIETARSLSRDRVCLSAASATGL